jgi:hypothetical protein
MKDKEQTAVEWLIDMHFGGIEHLTPYFRKHIEQAKEMERKRTIQFANDYLDDDEDLTVQQFYDLTYGGNK